MKPGPLLWVVHDTSHANAGFRIRTQPLMQALNRRGLDVRAITYAELFSSLPHLLSDVAGVILSKPNDSTSYLCLRVLQESGVPVALDLFDNYVSWSPGVAYRQLHWQWLRNVASASLVVTSTTYLEQVLATLRDGPLLRVADPLPSADRQEAETGAMADKWASVADGLNVTWFGMANNGYYGVGLEDLNDWRAAFQALRQRHGSAALQVTLCTNRVAALDSTLAMLRRDGIVARHVEWSEEACARLVAASHVVLLPTNLSGFSLSKTHNRCTDALVRQCLVLASPHGPYRALGGAVFLGVQPLLEFVQRAQHDPALVAQATATSLAHLSRECDLSENARRLHEALDTAQVPAVPERPAGMPANAADARVLIVARARLETVKLSRRMGYLTAGFADGVIKANLDFTLKAVASGPVMVSVQMSKKGWDALQSNLSSQAQLDVAESERLMVCRMRGWHAVVDKQALRFDVLQLPDAALAQALRLTQTMSVQLVHQVDRWYDTMVELLARLLADFGLARQDFATEEAGGWAAFARVTDPALAMAAERLHELWQTHASCELLWGEQVDPAQAKASA